jgi:hypothetical protein
MSTPYIPTRDSALDAWADNFQSKIAIAPGTYGLTSVDATAITNAFNLWHAAYLLGGSAGSPPIPLNPATFTRVTVAAKNAEKIAMVTLMRSYASQIRLDPGVANMDKTDLGLNLPNNSPSPIGVPVTFPLLAIAGAGPGTHELRFSDSSTPASRKKPFGAIGMQLFRGVGVAVITDPALCAWIAQVTANPYLSTFDPADAGKIATYFARWITRGKAAGGASGLVGPWSASVSMTVAF